MYIYIYIYSMEYKKCVGISLEGKKEREREAERDVRIKSLPLKGQGVKGFSLLVFPAALGFGVSKFSLGLRAQKFAASFML